MFRLRSLWKQVLISLILNWVIGPFVRCLRVFVAHADAQVMLGIAWATLPDLPTYRTGVIMVGLARFVTAIQAVLWLTSDASPWS